MAAPGDRIIVELDDVQERCDLDKIDDSGNRVTARTNLAFNTGQEIAREGASESGGTVWICHHSTRDDLRRYRQ